MTSLTNRRLKGELAEDVQQGVIQTPLNGSVHTAILTPAKIPASGPHAGKIESLSDLKPQFFEFLYDNSNPVFTKLMELIEQKSSIPREKFVGGTLALIAIYLIIGSGAEFLCNLIGFGYPAYASVQAIRSLDKSDDTEWLMYWTVFSSFSLLDFFAESIMSVVPLYWVGKSLFLLYLALPQTQGSVTIYVHYINPFVTKLENSIRKWTVQAQSS